MKQSYPFLYKLFALSVILIIGEIIYITLSSQFYTLRTNEEIRMADGQYYIYLLVVSVFFSVLLKRNNGSLTKIVLLFIIWGIFQSLQIIFNGYSFIILIRQQIWLILMICLFSTAKAFGADLFFRLFFVLLIVLVGYAITQIVFIKIQTSNTRSINVIYWVLLGFPFGFTIKQKWLKSICVVLIVFLALLSLKSTAIVAVGSSLLMVYYLTNHNNERKKRNRIWFVIVLVLLFLLLPVLIDILKDTLNLNWDEKAENSIETGGSGRVWLWELSLKSVFNSSFGELIIGHGHNSLVNVMRFSAHNDFLEILYDYGVIMFLIYINLFIQLFKIVLKMVRTRYEYASAFGVSIMVFISLSMFSHLMIYPGLLLMLGAFWGLCLGDFEYKKKYTY